MSQPSSPAIHNLASFFQWRCRRNPNDLAYAFVRDTLDVESHVTFGELERTVSSLADSLAREARPGTRALLLYPQGLDVVYAFWACACAGLVPVPVPAPDPIRRKHSLRRLRTIIEDARVFLVLTTSGLEDVASELSIARETSQLRWIATDHHDDAADSVEWPQSTDTSLAYLQYTSGSTATPRGVMISHRNVLAHCKALSLAGNITDSSRSLCWLPYFHDYGLLHGIIAPFYVGIPAYLMSPITFLRRPLRWLEAVARFGITHSGGPNFSTTRVSEPRVNSRTGKPI
ncbi:MAG: fatty acyl-AMP ligase [Nitrospira sp.]|nr:fatty acyl-AMP ligase [Nitrospira sp.]